MTAGYRSPILARTPSRFSAVLRRARVCSAWRAALALLLDDFLGRARHEVGVAELGVDLADLVGQLLDFLLQPRAFGLEVDDVADRQRIGRLAHHDLQRGLGRGRGGLDALDARQPLDRGAMHVEALPRRIVRRPPPGASAWRRPARSARRAPSGCRRSASPASRSRSSAAASIDVGTGQGWPISMPCSARWPSLSHSSSVMNGITGCRSLTVSRSTKAVTARVSSLSGPSVALQDRLGELDIPVADDAPDELVERGGRLVQAEFGDRLVDRDVGARQLAQHPLVDRELRRAGIEALGQRRAVHLGKARGVPELGGEVARALDARRREAQAAGLRWPPATPW